MKHGILRTALPLAVAVAASAPLAAQQRLPADSLELGRRWSTWFLAGRADSLAAHLVPDVLQSMGGVGGIEEAQALVSERAGMALKVLEERFVWRNGRRQYWRSMEMSVLPEPLLLRFVVLEDGRIGGIGIGPASEAPPADSSGAPIKP